uniref:Uncharacterized protein n=1 Tax=viral metagenome TaxID=1070528 RepID=A0A6M3IDG8_9ZZZZ
MLEAIPKEDSYTGFQARKAVLPKGITHKQSHYAQTVADNPEIVEKVIEEAIEKGAVPTTKEVLKEVAKEKHLEGIIMHG